MKADTLTNEELAVILRAMLVTAICPSRDEKEYLLEAANRLEQEGNYNGRKHNSANR